jgi:hypothetical protein
MVGPSGAQETMLGLIGGRGSASLAPPAFELPAAVLRPRRAGGPHACTWAMAGAAGLVPSGRAPY